MLKRLDNIGLGVEDVRRSLDFYISKLGFHGELTDVEGIARLGDIALFIFQAKRGADPVRRTVDYPSNPAGLDHLAFEVDDIGAAARDLERRGVVFEHDTVGEPGTFRYRGFRDPDGNMLYIIELA